MQPIFDFLMADKKTEEIEKTMKRSYYRGKPTRKMRRILKINQQMQDQASVVNSLLKKWYIISATQSDVICEKFFIALTALKGRFCQ